jgi:hypothetical protein|tara:strand:+ start:3340 stop:4293 length:954 start_codon:yes stop_codon:yes gene_type:complete
MYSAITTSSPALSQAEVSYLIDQFVDDVLRYKTLAFIPHPDTTKPYRMTVLGIDLQYLNQMIALFDGRVDYDYSEKLELFINACHDIRLEYDGYRHTCPDPVQDGCYLSEPETMNLLVMRIREMSKEADYRRRSADRRYRAKRQAEDIQAFVHRLTERYSKVLVLRINLYYREIARQRLTIEQVYADMDRLVAARRTNPLFKYLVGHIVRIEQGQDQGFHLHTAFFFNGSHVFRQSSIAERIGELWVDITQNRGYWHDSSREFNGDDDLRGTGMFGRSDIQGRQAIANLMTYLVKDKGQHLRIKPAGARALRTSLIR